MKIRNSIDHKLIDRAEAESYQILLNQNLSYANRWNSKVRPILRRFGISLCLMGIVISLFGIVIVRNNIKCSFYLGASTTPLVLYALIFVLILIFYYILPKSKNSISNWHKNIYAISCKRTARSCVKNAKKLAPFEAEYDIDGELISYYRWSDDSKTFVWSRKLKGVAIHGTSVTLLFKKWTSVSPTMVILHQDFDVIKPVLEHLHIESKSILMEGANQLEGKDKT